MIRKLRLRMSLLVIGVLIAVSVGIVAAIYMMNNRNIAAQAEASLDVLAANSGHRPQPPEFREAPFSKGEITPPPKPEGETPPEKPEEEGGSEPEDSAAQETDGFPGGAEPPSGPEAPRAFRQERAMSLEEIASLSNYYTMTLDENGKIDQWESDRADLYSKESLQLFTDQVLSGGRKQGRIGTQFYRLTESGEGRKLIVLDARLEMQAGQRVLATTSLVAGIACLLLSLGAWLLIRRMVKPVEEAFAKQQQFVWDASHELKTPLAVISANADLLDSEIGENEYLGYIRSEVKRTDELVKNLLTLARMDRGTAECRMEETDFSDAVLSVLLPFESTVFEAGKQMESEIQEQVRVMGNAALLQQLTVILLSNALKYSNPGGTITVALKKKGRGAELRVRNTGEGIAPADLERIFDRFYRTDASRNSETGGEGLGLAIARSITEIHHGKIEAESRVGEYAEFIVTIP